MFDNRNKHIEHFKIFDLYYNAA